MFRTEENKFLGNITGHSLTYRKNNEEIREICGVQDLVRGQ